MQAEFAIVSCQADIVASVVIDVHADSKARFDSGECFDFDIADEFAADAMSAAGIGNYVCDGCYSSAYSVRFIRFIE